MTSPDGGSDASLGTHYGQTPFTTTSVIDSVLGQPSDFQAVCTSPVQTASSGSGQSQASEVTGVYQGKQIHAIVIASVFTPNGTRVFTAESRSMFTPAGQWSPSAVQELSLIIKRAIFSPSSP